MKDEALKLALEGAANYIDALGGDSRKYRQALAAPVLEHDHSDQLTIAYMSGVHRGKELAAQRQWVGLTLADREKLRDQFEGWNYPAILVDAVSDILKEKNT
jgi:hypothetical protein